LLPVIAERKAPRVRCCVFVDASIPAPEGRSPLVSAEFLQALEAMAKDGRVPRWSEWWPEEAMRAFVPDEDLRRQISEETPCLPLACFRDSVPVPAGWTNMPCGYLHDVAVFAHGHVLRVLAARWLDLAPSRGHGQDRAPWAARGARSGALPTSTPRSSSTGTVSPT
jgi:hypothetical protein